MKSIRGEGDVACNDFTVRCHLRTQARSDSDNCYRYRGGTCVALILAVAQSCQRKHTIRHESVDGDTLSHHFGNGGSETEEKVSMRLTRVSIANSTKRVFLLAGVLFVIASANSCASKSRDSIEPTGPASSAVRSAEQCEALYLIHQSATQDPSYRIQQGDQLAIDFYLNSEFNDNVTVDPDGKIALRLVGQLHAEGQTPEKLAAAIDKAYQNELRNPGAVVHVHNMPGRQIYVEGEVSKPGAFPLQPGMTVVQAVALAGGTTVDSAPDNTVLIRHDACGQAQGSEVRLSDAVKHPGAGNDVALMSQDVVVVPRSRIANIDLFVKQYIKGVLPIEPYLNMPM